MIMTGTTTTNLFSAEFPGYVGHTIWTAVDDFTITARLDGFTITARLEFDDYASDQIFSPESRSNPWCGLTVDWTPREALEGERVVDGKYPPYRRYYRFSTAVDHIMSNGFSEEEANELAEASYQRLVSLVNGEWNYVEVVLSVSKCGIVLDNRAASRGGLKSDDTESLMRAADELVDEAIAAGRDMIAELIK
jgi:hypothetical protein